MGATGGAARVVLGRADHRGDAAAAGGDPLDAAAGGCRGTRSRGGGERAGGSSRDDQVAGASRARDVAGDAGARGEVMNDEQMSPLDRATAQRLGKLRTMPVDTSRVAARLQAEVGAPAKLQSGRHRAFRPMRAVAASVLLLIALAASFLVWSARPAVASAQLMAQMHDDLVSGRTPVMQVDSIED